MSGARRFLLLCAAWLLGLLALSRLPLVRDHVLLPLTGAQGRLATAGDPAAAAAVAVTLECSGGDVIALVLAAVFAAPSSWRRRLAAAAGGTALVLAVNTLRIASLARAAGTPAFAVLHLYVWPTVLASVAVLYALGWLWLNAPRSPGRAGRGRWAAAAALAVLLLCAFALAVPVLERSPAMAALAEGLAAMAAALMTAAGLSASARGAVLATARGAFLVTPECLLTPLLPVYVAAAAALTRSWRTRALALAAAPALFGLLALARLCVLAVPAAVAASPLVLIHGFHQLVLGAALVLVAAGLAPASAPRRRVRVAGSLAAALAAAAAAPLLRTAIEAAALALTPWAPHTLTRLATPGDVQGALALLPAYQAGLFAALWLARFGGGHGRRLAAGLGILGLGQVAVLVLLGEAAAHATVAVPATLLRAWAVLAPLAVMAALSPRAAVAAQGAQPDPVPA